MRTSGGAGRGQQWLIAVLFLAMLIDGFLLAIVRANFLHDHGYDAGAQRPAIAEPAAPRRVLRAVPEIQTGNRTPMRL